MFNIHNDYKSRGNRLKTSELIADRIAKIAQENLPIIVLGDFNVPKGFKEIRLLEAIGLRVVPSSGATNRILGMHILPAIDHILISREFRPQTEIKVWRNRYDGVYPADHYPISAKLTF
jgi:endonuclease/exonuclease/phosphatase family metal-dependent hydrolase